MDIKPFEYIEHTADAGMRVWGETLTELFKNAACGLFQMIAMVETIDETLSVEVKITADHLEMLFVHWLDELIFIHETKDIFLRRSNIQQITPTCLSAEVYGETVDFEKHSVYTEIKAVTYHQLSVTQRTSGVWEAHVIFDL